MSKKKIIDSNARQIRGGILNGALEVENVLTECIGYFYSKKDDYYSHSRLVEDILADLTFDKKIRIFSKKVDLSFGIFKKYPNIIKDLHEIRTIRNQIAHRNISYPWIFDETDIDENDFNYITEKYTDWKEKCDFHKPGKEAFSFSLEDLEKFEQKCQLVIMLVGIGTNELLSPIDK